MTPTFASKCLIHHLPILSVEHPDIELRVLATDAVSDFERDGVDLAVRLTKPPFPLGQAAEFLFSDMIVVGSASLVSGYSLPLTSENIADFTLLNDGQAIWRPLLGDRTAKAELHINQAALAIKAAISGQGLAMANRIFLVADQITFELLLRLLVAFDIGQVRNTVALQASMQRRAC